MKHKQAFFILEFLMYLALFSALSLLLMRFVVSSSLQLSSQSKKANKILSFISAVDIIAQEILTAPSCIDAWRHKDEDYILWHEQKNCYKGICKKDNRVLYLQRTFNSHKGTWKKKHKGLIANDIKQLSFHYSWQTIENEPDQLQAIKIELEGIITDESTIKVSKMVSLRNRIIT